MSQQPDHRNAAPDRGISLSSGRARRQMCCQLVQGLVYIRHGPETNRGFALGARGLHPAQGDNGFAIGLFVEGHQCAEPGRIIIAFDDIVECFYFSTDQVSLQTIETAFPDHVPSGGVGAARSSHSPAYLAGCVIGSVDPRPQLVKLRLIIKISSTKMETVKKQASSGLRSSETTNRTISPRHSR